MRRILEERIKQINYEAGDLTVIDGYKITAEQCLKINEGNKEAVDLFFEQNYKRMSALAYRFLRFYNMLPYLKCRQGLICLDDCLNQAYVDMRRGYLKLALKKCLISHVLWHSFRYSGVGGFGDEDGAYISNRLWT